MELVPPVCEKLPLADQPRYSEDVANSRPLPLRLYVRCYRPGLRLRIEVVTHWYRPIA